MINYRCAACGHWMQSSDHLIDMTVSCRECGELVVVPARSAPHVPHSATPSQVARLAALGVTTPDDPAEQGPVEAGWQRLHETANRLFPQAGQRGLLFTVGIVGLLIVLIGVVLAWWLL
jgi:hypothetical protein